MLNNIHPFKRVMVDRMFNVHILFSLFANLFLFSLLNSDSESIQQHIQSACEFPWM